MILYSLRRTADGYLMAKFDDDFNVEATYEINPSPTKLGASPFACSCPAGPRPSCKHRKMIPTFVTAGKCDTSSFYCYETQTWHQPIAGPWDQDDPGAREAMEAITEKDWQSAKETSIDIAAQPTPLRRLT